MPVQIDLNNLSADKLSEIGKEKEIELKDTPSKYTLIERIAKKVPEEEIFQISKDFIYAGRTSISWYVINEEKKIKIDQNSLTNILISCCDGKNPFEDTLRPKITRYPKIISAKYYDKDKLRILFVMGGRTRHQIIGYNFQQTPPTEFINVILRYKDMILEVRASHSYSNIITESFAAKMNKTNIVKVDLKQLSITEDDFVSLKKNLNAIIDDYTGKCQDGSIYDTKSVTRSPDCEDLWREPEFQRDIKGTSQRSSGIIFESPFQSNERIRLDVSSRQNSIFFRNYVSERIIDQVYRVLRRIKK